MIRPNENRCTLCHRLHRTGTTEHHLIPRTCHRNKWFKARFTRQQMQQTIPVCRDCHRAIHDMIPREKDLGRHYHSVPTLLAHEKLGRFVQWASKQR